MCLASLLTSITVKSRYKLVRNRLEELWLVELRTHDVALARLVGDALGNDTLSSLFSSLFSALNVLNSLEEVEAAVGVLDMLHTHVDVLGNDAAPHALVYDDTDSMRCDIEHTPSSPVITLVGHTLLHSTCSLDVHDISSFICFEICSQWNNAFGLVSLTKHVTSTTAVSFGVRHDVTGAFYYLKLISTYRYQLVPPC